MVTHILFKEGITIFILLGQKNALFKVNPFASSHVVNDEFLLKV
jgi:hypothetical protein